MVAGAFEDTPREPVLTAARPGSSIRDTRGDRIFNVFNYFVLTLFLLVVALSAALHRQRLVQQPAGGDLGAGLALAGRLHPRRLRRDLPRTQLIVRGFLNSIFYTVVGTALNVTLTILAAYPLSRKDLYGRGVIMFLFFFTLLFSGGLIPTYLVVKTWGCSTPAGR